MILVNWPVIFCFAIAALSVWLLVATCLALWRNRRQQTNRKIWLYVLALPIFVGCIAGVIVGSGLAMVGLNVRKGMPVYSPDGRHAASVEYMGPLMVDGETVYIYSRSGFWRDLVFIKAGKDEPQLSWPDDRTLIVQYSGWNYGNYCHNTARVDVRCIQASGKGN